MDFGTVNIPQLRKDYFFRDSEKREADDQLMVRESKQLIKRLKKADQERSGILTLENRNEVRAELAKLLGEAKKLKKGTPITLEALKALKAKNLEDFSNRVAQVIAETLGTTPPSTTEVKPF